DQDGAWPGELRARPVDERRDRPAVEGRVVDQLGLGEPRRVEPPRLAGRPALQAVGGGGVRGDVPRRPPPGEGEAELLRTPPGPPPRPRGPVLRPAGSAGAGRPRPSAASRTWRRDRPSSLATRTTVRPSSERS